MASEDLSGHKIKSTNKFQETHDANLVRPVKAMRYVSLHHHTTFSFRDGYGLPEAHNRRAAELGMQALAVTEHGNVSSHVKHEKAGLKYGIKPIFGCELYAGDVDEERRSQRKNHLTVLARTQDGYKNLLRTVSQAWEDFYYEPTTSGANLAKHRNGLYVLSGCQGSLLATSLIGGKNVPEDQASYARAKAVAKRMQDALGDSFMLEVQMFPQLPKAKQINRAYEQLSKELHIPLIATGDVHYTRPDESDMQVILHAVRGGGSRSFEEQAREWGYDVKLSPPLSDKEAYRRLVGTGLSRMAAQEAMFNTIAVAQDCNVTLPKLAQVQFPLPEGYTSSQQVWEAWLKQGWLYRGMHNRPDWRIYQKRLLYEMDIIQKKGFIDYFLVVADALVWAKDQGIFVGPARGSAAASLVCYLLRITEVDPMQWPSLVFERFIDLTREDLPDIDIDLDDGRRIEVQMYLADKYGLDRVANIGTFAAYKGKNSLDDIARVYRIPKQVTEELKGYMIERSSGDLRADSTIEDTAAMFPRAAEIFEQFPKFKQAMRLEGNYRQLGIHAAGMVVASAPITEACAIYTRTTDDKTTRVISLDKYDAEYLNILKVDLLGLSTMGKLATACGWLDMTMEDLTALPLDDRKTIEGFRKNDIVGIFQFDGRAQRSVNAEVRPDNIFEIADIGALARPGPLHGGGTGEYIDVKKGNKPRRTVHPIVDDICAPTYGTIVYQEQILRIVREVGNFDWTHASYIRKIISKKLGEQEFNRQWERFWQGAESHGMDERTARTIWNECITAGAYAFNAAHSVAYGLVGYWDMWVKQHHPTVFYAASLARLPETKRKGSKQSKHLDLMKDAVAHGVQVLPPDLATSGLTWQPAGAKAIRAGLVQVRGIGEKSALRILAARDTGDIKCWDDMTSMRGFGVKKVKMVVDFVSSDDPFGIFALERKLNETRRLIRSGRYRNVPIPTFKADTIPYARGKDTEVVWCGVITHRNLRDIFELHFSRTGTELDPESVKHPELREYVNMVGRDEMDTVTLVINRYKYERFKAAVWGLKGEDDVVLVRGTKPGNQSYKAIYVTDMWVFGEEEDTDDE